MRRLLTELVPVVKAYKKLEAYNFRKPQLLIIGSSADVFNELAAFLGANNNADLSWIDLKQIIDIDEDVALRIESADLVLIYSNDPVVEASSVTFAVEALRMLTFRYLVILYGKDSEIVARLISESSKINPCKVRAVNTRIGLLEVLSLLPVSLLPLETLPFWLELRLYDGKRKQMAVRLLLDNLIKIIGILGAFPVVVPLYLDDFLAVFSSLIKKIDRSKKVYKYAAFVPLLAGEVLKRKMPKVRRSYFAGISLLFAAVFFSLFDRVFEE